MTALTARRGPDDQGMWNDDRCALGFRRLSILDLSETGHQPMLTPDERHALVFNGEVYNFRELRAELIREGAVFRSTGDAEVVLWALRLWGRAAIARFNGMFAFGFYARDTGCLLLARDHAGIKPLYYLIAPHGVVFASQLNQLLVHPWGRACSVSPEGVGLYLRFGAVPAPYSPLEGIRQVEPGSWVEVGPEGRVETGTYWAFPDHAPAAPLSPEQGAEVLDAALSRAVARQMISDVPVGVFLSGGIDSPLVAAEARRHHAGPLKGFTISVPGTEMDERDDARAYAREIGLEHIVEAVTPANALALIDQVAEATSEPLYDPSLFPTLLVSRLAREHVTVVLSGDGGDELFWGYPGHFAPTIEQARYYKLPRWARYGWIAARRYGGLGKATRDVLFSSVGRLVQRKQTVFPEADLAAVFPELPPLPNDFALFDYDGHDPDAVAYWARWIDFRLHLSRILVKVDRASMYHGLEVRVPLLDRDVIEVAARTRWQDALDLSSRVGKRPLRAALERRVRHHTQGKRGFDVPIHEWLTGPLQSLLIALVVEQRELLGLDVSRTALRALNQRLLGGDRFAALGLWSLLSLALWQRRHLAAVSAPALACA